MLAGVEAHPHAKAVLTAALPPGGSASHAYLFHGPAGAGKAAVALEFAAALLSDGAPDPENARTRVMHRVHPDLTWVQPTGAREMRISDIDQPVVNAATHTPFEARRRVFVIERVDTMNDEAANRMLKTLEEPPSYVHLVLLTDRPGDVLPTVASRCQLVRFEAPTPDEIAATLTGIEPLVAQACARLALGDARRAAGLAFGDGPALRAGAEAYARATIAGVAALADRPWAALLELARAAGTEAGKQVAETASAEAELLPSKDANRYKREAEESARRADRRARIDALDEALQLAGLWLRDVACLVDGAPELVHHADREAELRADAERFTSAHGLRDAVAAVDETRTAITLINAGEELQVEALASRLERTLAAGQS